MTLTPMPTDPATGWGPLVAPAADLTPDERARYQRHLTLPGLGETGQRRLKAARVLVLGAGGLGSPALMYLAAAGVGTLGVVDFDRVEASNLQRQVLHGQSDLGSSKVTSALTTLRELNPLVTLREHHERLTRAGVAEVFADYDLVVDGTDNFETRYLANDAAYLAGIPYVWASILRFDAQVSVFAPRLRAGSPCYRCLTPRQPPPGVAPSCVEGGVLGALCGVVGSMQATEAVKLITGLGRPLVGRVLVYDALTQQQRLLPVQRDPECALCGDAPTITTVDSVAARGVDDPHAIEVETLAQWLREPGRVRVIDVREPHEHAAGCVPGADSVPLARWLDGSALSDLPARGDSPALVLHCQSGVRSAQALRVLHEAGHVDAVHLRGGYAAWDAAGL